MTTGRVWCEYALLPGGVVRDVLVSTVDGRVASVDVGVAAPGDARRRGGVTLPGAADVHSHAFHRALRHRSQSGRGTFWTWREQMYAVAARLDPDSYRRLARAVFAEMALAGFTSVGEFHYVHHTADGRPYADPNAMGAALAAAAADAGVRITILDTAYLHGGLADGSYQPRSVQQERFSDGSVERWEERATARTGLGPHVRLGAAIHSVRAVDADSAARVAQVATANGWPLHAHVSEQPAENEQCRAAYGRTPTEVLADAGVLAADFTAVHATHLSDRDVELLGTAGVCLCPTTERDLADGVGPARRLADAGARLSIGTDSHAVVDAFGEARAIELDERLVTNERGVHTAAELAAILTNGHTSLGWHDAGSIAVGQRADLVTVALDTPRTAGARPDHVLEAVVFAATAAEITDVTIDGVDVVVDGRHRSVDVACELDSAIADLTGATR